MRPWEVVARAASPAGPLELRRRGEQDFLITVSGRVLMNSAAQQSEIALGELACAPVAKRHAPRVLIGGLGMGITLRAALDVLPETAHVVVVELSDAVVAWCRGPLAELTDRAVADPRVEVVIGDVATAIRDSSRDGPRCDAILLDLYEGPAGSAVRRDDAFYGARALALTKAALARSGVFAVWAEAPDAAFEKRLAAAGFEVSKRRPGRGGLRHVVYVAKA